MRRFAPIVLALLALAVVVAAPGCGRYTRLAKSRKLADRDTAAMYYYSKKAYESASVLLEELMGAYRGQPRAEAITYYYAQTKLAQRELITAGYHFKQFVEQFPNSPRAEECFFLVGYCHYLLSNPFELEQNDTDKALESFQLFLSLYPSSDRVKVANEYMAELRGRKGEKDYRNAALFLKIGQFRAAVVALKNFLADHPDSKYREEAQFQLFQSSLLYAEQSIDQKLRSRYLEAFGYHQRFVTKYPQSLRIPEADLLFIRLQAEMKRLEIVPES
jgi:outer membrane protein assembly factor BamD